MQIRSKIQMCIKGLNVKGCLMSIDHESIYVGGALRRVIVKHTLNYLQPTAIYNYTHPDRLPKDETNADFVKVKVVDSFRDIDILKELVAWLKNESENKEKITKGIPLQLRTSLQLEGWLNDHPEEAHAIECDIEADVAERKRMKGRDKKWLRQNKR